MVFEAAKIYKKLNQYDQAEDYAFRAYKIDNNNEPYTYLYAKVLANQKKYPKAKTIYKSLIKTNSKEQKYFYELADVYIFSSDFKSAIKDLLDGNVDISQLVISKTVKTDYANPTQIAHKVLADRMGERDPGNKPKANDRIPFAYIQVDDKPIPVGFKKAYELQGTGEYKKIRKRVESGEYFKKDKVIEVGLYKNGNPKTKKVKEDDKTRPKYKWIEEKGPEIMKKVEVQGEPKYKKKVILQGERIEHPDYIKEKNLPLDYKFYISNQIMNPVKQVLDISMSPEESKELFNKFLQ